MKIAYKPPYPWEGERAAPGLQQCSPLDPDYTLGLKHYKGWLLHPPRVGGSKCVDACALRPVLSLLSSPQREPFCPGAHESFFVVYPLVRTYLAFLEGLNQPFLLQVGISLQANIGRDLQSSRRKNRNLGLGKRIR